MMWLLLALSAFGVEPAWRWVTTDDGLVSEHVAALAQGPDGFVWIGSHAGVYRYDGVRAVRQDGGALATETQRLVAAPDGAMYARTATGRAFRLAGGDVVPVRTATGDEVRVADLAVDGAGVVWAAQGEGLHVVRGAALDPVPAVSLPAGARVVRASEGAGFLVGTGDAWYLAAPGRPPQRLADAEIAMDAAPDGEGGAWVIEVGRVGARVRHLGADGVERFSRRYEARGLSVAVRDDAVWASFVGVLARIDRRSGDVATWGLERGILSGGPLLVDREGSLWLGTFRGVGLLADPDAALRDRRDGLAGDAHRFVAAHGERVWASSWDGLSVVDGVDGGAPVARSVPSPLVKGPVCVDGAGAAWTVGADGFSGPAQIVRFVDDAPTTWPLPAGSHFESGCATDPDGAVWIAAADGLWRAAAGDDPRRVADWPHPELASAVKAVTVAPGGAVLVAGGLRVCSFAADAWACANAPGGLPLSDVEALPGGEVWVVQMGEGVLRREGDGFVPIPGTAALASRFVNGLRAADDGTVWVLGHGVVARVAPAPDEPAGWRVVEELAPWLGHLVSGASDLVERPDGALWIAHNGGLTHVPASSRRPVFAPPPVHVVDLRVAGQPVAGPLVDVPDGSVAVSARFAAASYRAPALLRYRVRVDDGAWGPARPDGIVELRALDVGLHRVEVAASLDGVRWTDPPAAITLQVPRPWYGRWEIWAALAASLGALALAVERARAAVALRIERLRTGIALDLHDNVGAGLGAIGLLGGLLARPDLPPAARDEAARRVASIAEELSAGLRGIVWSLRVDSTYTDVLGRYLAERARSLLPGLDAAGALHLAVSEERQALDVDVLRAVQLIGLEALHNAARHAHAAQVWLTLGPAPDGGWALVVEDDGVGLDAAEGRVDGGNGLGSMASRAAAIGATIRIGPRPGAGTRIELRFRPRRRRLAAWLGLR